MLKSTLSIGINSTYIILLIKYSTSKIINYWVWKKTKRKIKECGNMMDRGNVWKQVVSKYVRKINETVAAM